MVRRKGRPSGQRPRRGPRRARNRMQSNLQRIKSGTVRSARISADPPARNLYGAKSGTVEIRCRVGSTASTDYGSPVTPAIIVSVAYSYFVTNVVLKNCIAQQLLGLKKDDLASGSLQYSISNIQVWGGENRKQITLGWQLANYFFPKTYLTDTSSKMARPKLKMSLPHAVWLNDDDASTALFFSNVEPTPAVTAGEEVLVFRISVQYHASLIVSA